jgi:hypothetical protein
MDMHGHAPISEATRPHQIPATTPPPPPPPPPRAEEADHLRAAQSLIEREVTRPDLAPNDAEGLREVLYALRERNAQRVSLVFRDVFKELTKPSEAMRRAYDHLEAHFRQS